MGVVKMETPAQNRGCHEYENISLSDYRMVSLLIKHRSEIYPMDTLDQSFSFKELMTCIYVDLDKLIKDVSLTKTEKTVIDLLMIGYTVSDIVEERGMVRQHVDMFLSRASKKISNLHNKRWLAQVNKKYKNVELFRLME